MISILLKKLSSKHERLSRQQWLSVTEFLLPGQEIVRPMQGSVHPMQGSIRPMQGSAHPLSPSNKKFGLHQAGYLMKACGLGSQRIYTPWVVLQIIFFHDLWVSFWSLQQ